MDWQVYMILCSDNSIYTGISNNITKRWEKHNTNKGAKYFRGRKPLRLLYLEAGHNRSSASKREYAIKKMPRKDKLTLLASELNCLHSAFTDKSNFT